MAAATSKRRAKPTINGKADKARANKGVKVVIAVACVILGVSVEHLAHGFATMTGTSIYSAWALALAVDAGLVVAELSLIMFGAVLPEIRRYAHGIVALVLPMSMFLNFQGFRGDGKSDLIAAVFGIWVPVLLWCCAKMGGTLWIAANRNPVKAR